MPKWKRLSPEMIELLLAQGGRCFYCGFPMPTHTRNQELMISRDHFIPKCKGGTDKDNIVLCHIACNQEKGDTDPTPTQVRTFKALQAKLKANRVMMDRLFNDFKAQGIDCLAGK